MAETAAGVEIRGVDDLLERLAELPRLVQGKEMKRALEAAARRVRSAVKRRAPKGPTGTLRQRVSSGVYVRNGQVRAWVGSRAPHTHLVELGTVERVRKSGGRTGRMPEIPFLHPAVEEYRPRFRDDVEKAVEKALAKAAAKAGKGRR